MFSFSVITITTPVIISQPRVKLREIDARFDHFHTVTVRSQFFCNLFKPLGLQSFYFEEPSIQLYFDLRAFVMTINRSRPEVIKSPTVRVSAFGGFRIGGLTLRRTDRLLLGRQ